MSNSIQNWTTLATNIDPAHGAYYYFATDFVWTDRITYNVLQNQILEFTKTGGAVLHDYLQR